MSLIDNHCCDLQDYGDGGAYPEIHVAQFPLLMGKQKTTSNALAKTLDAEGKVRYDIIARQGHGKDKVGENSVKTLCCFQYVLDEKGIFALAVL